MMNYLGNKSDLHFNPSELTNIEEKLRHKILSTCVEMADTIEQDDKLGLIYLLNTLQDKHLEQVLILERMKTILNLGVMEPCAM